MEEIIAYLRSLLYEKPFYGITQHDLLEISNRIQIKATNTIQPLLKDISIEALDNVLSKTDNGDMNIEKQIQIRLATYLAIKQNGSNCLISAITFGTMMKSEGYHVELGILPDHAVIIITVGNEKFLCDPSNNIFVNLQGYWIFYPGFSWYEVVTEDSLYFNYLIIHNFNRGIINGLVQNCACLKIPYVLGADSSYWVKLQQDFFSDLNEYKKIYEIEYLLECEFIANYRERRELINLFSDIRRLAFKDLNISATTTENIKSFYDKYFHEMQEYADEIIQFFETGIPFRNESCISKTIRDYFTNMRNHVIGIPGTDPYINIRLYQNEPEKIMEFALGKIKLKLNFKQELIIT